MLGSTDTPLSDRGCADAEQLARLLASRSDLRVVYTSPLRRAAQTASRILQANRPVIILESLAEISYGPWEGKTWDDIEAADPDLAQKKIDDWFGTVVPGAEQWDQFRRRVHRALTLIQQGPFPAVVVGHQAVNSVIAEVIANTNPLGFQQDYGQVLELEWNSDQR